MNFSYLGIVKKDILNRKFSSFLTLFAISLGILSIFVIIVISDSFEKSINSQFENLGSNRLYVKSKESSLASNNFKDGLSESDLKLIESLSYVDKVYPYYIRKEVINFGREYNSLRIIGSELSPDFFKDLNFNLDIGRFPRKNEKFSAVIGSRVYSDSFSKNLNVGSSIYISDTKFKVVGILKSVGNPDDDSNIYVNIDSLREIFKAEKDIGILDVILLSGVNVDFASENLQIFLDRRVGKDVLEVISPSQLLDQLNSILLIVNVTLGMIAVISIIVGAFGIINTMYVIVTEKTKDIGIMKAIGATNFNILLIYMFQAGIFGFLGALLGLFLGYILLIFFEKAAVSSGFSFFRLSLDYFLFLYLLIFGFLIGIISGFFPARRASKLNVIKSMVR